MAKETSSAELQTLPRDELEMRDLIEISTVEVLAQQLEAERQHRAKVQVTELLIVSGLLGITFGASYAMMRYSRTVKFVEKKIGKSRKRKRK